MKAMEIKACHAADCATLARLNKQLIEDEGHDNSMSIDELQTRMESFISSEYRAVYFIEAQETIGYALVKTTSSPYYLRRFFVGREHRRKGYGRRAFAELLKHFSVETIDIEVLHWNHVGIAFWESLGFQPRSVYMRYGKHK